MRIAIQNIDAIIAIIRGSENAQKAKFELESKFQLSEKQSTAIVEMKLRSLTGLEIEKIEKEYNELIELVKNLKDILANKDRRMSIIHEELGNIKEKYGDERRTSIEDNFDNIDILDIIPNEPMVITVSDAGYIKRASVDTYKSQARGGVGISATSLKDEDFVQNVFMGWSHSYILVFTNLGRCHWLQVYTIPESSRTAKGKALVNLIQLQTGEKVSAFIPIKDFSEPKSLIFATRNGIVNKMDLSAFAKKRSTGVNAIAIDENDSLIKVLLAEESQDIMVATHSGQAIRFPMNKFKKHNRNTRGVKGISFKENDFAIGVLAVFSNDDRKILTITNFGYGKRTSPQEYRITNRGGSGVRNITLAEKSGKAIFFDIVSEQDECMILTKNGSLIKIKVADISSFGRSAKGVKVIRLKNSDTVADAETLSIEKINSSESPVKDNSNSEPNNEQTPTQS